MATLTIEIPDKVEKTLSDLVEQLGGKIVSVGSNENKKSTRNKAKLTVKEEKFLKEFDEAIEFVNQYQQGKVKAKTIDEFLNEL